MAVALTSEQKARIEVAQKRVLDASNTYNSAAQAAADAARVAADCQAARDRENGGLAKNRACHIDALSGYNSYWDQMNALRDNAAALLNNAKLDLANVLTTIEKENKLAADALKNDPEYNLKTQANILASDELQNQADRDRNKKIILIVAIVALVGIIGGATWYIVKKGKGAA